MRNKYPAICYRCGKQVDVGDGFFEKTNTTHIRKWGVQNLPKFICQHASCAEIWKGTNKHYKYEDQQCSQ